MSAESGSLTLTVRVATAADAALLATTAEAMFRDAFAATNDAAQMDAYCATHYAEAIQLAELESDDIRVLLLEEAGRVVAFAQLRLDTPEAEIWRFYVDRAHHGRGVAQRLMDESLQLLRENGAESVVLAVWENNPRAIAFYRKHGFTVTGAQPFILGTEAQTDYVMTRELETIDDRR